MSIAVLSDTNMPRGERLSRHSACPCFELVELA